jgi:ATP-dependent helicase HepA
VHARVLRELEEGRDRLLELSSFRPRAAESLIAEIRNWDEDEGLDRFVERALDYLGVELDPIGPRTFVFRQGSQLVVEALPGLRSEEVGMTSDRFKATHQGELDFLTWDHPMVTGVMEILLGGEHGNSSVAVLPAREPSALLECVFVLEPIAAAELDVARFLPPTLVRVVVDHGGRDVTGSYPPETLADELTDGRRQLRGVFANVREELVPRMLGQARSLAETRAPGLVEEARAAMRVAMGRELDRLRSLREVNDHVREAEVLRVAEERKLLETALDAARLRLDALRFVYAGSVRSG